MGEEVELSGRGTTISCSRDLARLRWAGMRGRSRYTVRNEPPTGRRRSKAIHSDLGEFEDVPICDMSSLPIPDDGTHCIYLPWSSERR